MTPIITEIYKILDDLGFSLNRLIYFEKAIGGDE